jgi:hypothetical protein
MKRPRWVIATAILAVGLSAGAFAENRNDGWSNGKAAYTGIDRDSAALK